MRHEIGQANPLKRKFAVLQRMRIDRTATGVMQAKRPFTMKAALQRSGAPFMSIFYDAEEVNEFPLARELQRIVSI
jgi:hypothetical protein